MKETCRPNNIKLNINKIIIDDSNTINNNSQKKIWISKASFNILNSTKERIINLAFEMTYKGYFLIFNKNLNDRFQEFNNMSSNKFDIVNKTEENEFNTIKNINQKLKPDLC